FVTQMEILFVHPVVGHQQPTGASALNLMQGVARRCPRHLRHEDLGVAPDEVVQNTAPCDFMAKCLNRQHRHLAIGHLQHRVACQWAADARVGGQRDGASWSYTPPRNLRGDDLLWRGCVQPVFRAGCAAGSGKQKALSVYHALDVMPPQWTGSATLARLHTSRKARRSCEKVDRRKTGKLSEQIGRAHV